MNTACFRRQGQGTGQGQGRGQFPGQGSGFQGLTGTVDSAGGSKLTFDDTQGQTYSVAITSATVIQKTATAQASDLKAGMKVTVAAQDAAGTLTARSITIQS